MSGSLRSFVPDASLRIRDFVSARARSVVRSLHGTPLDHVLDSTPASKLRERAFSASPTEVLAILNTCREADVDCWLAGGWGVDALVGRQTRRHGDIDLCIDVVDEGEVRAIAALERIGYRVTMLRGESGRLFPERPVLRSAEGRVIDLLLVTTDHDAETTGSPLLVLGADEVAEGSVEGTAVPCLSAELQLRTHTGYVPTDVDRRDVAMLCEHAGIQPPHAYMEGSSSQPHDERGRLGRWVRQLASLLTGNRQATALVISVPAVESALAAVNSSELKGLGPHVTVLFPFAPLRQLGSDEREKLRELATATQSFGFSLTRLATFPGVLYLEPEPAAAFVDLTRAAAKRFPDCQPYGGAFPEIIPHLTVAYGLEPQDLAFTIEPLLPIECDANEIVLMVCDRWGRWRARERYPFAQDHRP